MEENVKFAEDEEEDHDLKYLWFMEFDSIEECFRDHGGPVNTYVGDGIYITPCGTFEDDVATECECGECYPKYLCELLAAEINKKYRTRKYKK